MNGILESLKKVVEYLVLGMYLVFNQVIKAFAYVWNLIIDEIRALFPNLEFPDLTILADYWATADVWIPLTEGSALFLLWIAFWMGAYGVKIAVAGVRLARGGG